MLKSYKNKEFISSLNAKELKDYYDCYFHHHSSRNKCNTKINEIKLNESDDCCPCTKETNENNGHFCTGHRETCLCHNDSCLVSNSHSLIVCENYAPSYTSKTDQIQTLKREVTQIKESKQLLKQAMKDLDKLLNENEPKKSDLDHLNEVEKFYRSNKFIGSSLNIKTLHKDLPRQDIKPSKYIFNQNLNHHKLVPVYATSLFSFYDRNTFTDKELLEKEAALKPKKKENSSSNSPDLIETRPVTIYSRQK